MLGAGGAVIEGVDEAEEVRGILGTVSVRLRNQIEKRTTVVKVKASRDRWGRLTSRLEVGLRDVVV